LTGEVYYNQADDSGNLKKWGYANKIVAFVILVAQVFIIFARVMGVIGDRTKP